MIGGAVNRQKQKNSVVVVLDNVRSLHNVGAVFRSCDAFGVESLLLCGITGTPPHPSVDKVALGATASVHWRYYPTTKEALHCLSAANYWLVAVEQTKESRFLHALGHGNGEFLAKKRAFIFGHEVYGVDKEALALADEKIEIPQMGAKRSLNVSVSVGIVLWEATKQFFSAKKQ